MIRFTSLFHFFLPKISPRFVSPYWILLMFVERLLSNWRCFIAMCTRDHNYQYVGFLTLKTQSPLCQKTLKAYSILCYKGIRVFCGTVWWDFFTYLLLIYPGQAVQLDLVVLSCFYDRYTTIAVLIYYPLQGLILLKMTAENIQCNKFNTDTVVCKSRELRFRFLYLLGIWTFWVVVLQL